MGEFAPKKCPALLNKKAEITGIVGGNIQITLTDAAGRLAANCVRCDHNPDVGGDCPGIKSNGSMRLGGFPQYVMNWPDPMVVS